MTPTPSHEPDHDPPLSPDASAHNRESSALAWRDPALDGTNGAGSKEMLRTRAEDDTTRELYAHLINLLSQDGTPREEPPRKPPLEGVLALLRRRWLPMLLVFALSSLALSRVLKPGPPMFSATASMLLPPAPSVGKSASIDDGSDTVARQYDNEAQIAIITAPRIVDRSVALLTPEQKIAGWGSDKIRSVPIQASSLTSPNIIDITVTSLNPNASKRLANIIGGVYKLDTFERTNQARQQDVEFITQQATSVRGQLAAAQDAVRNFKQQSGVNNAQTAIAGSEQNIQSLQGAAEAARTEAAAGLGSQTVSGDSTLSALRQAAETARARYEALRVDFQDTAPRVIQARVQWQTAQQAADARAQSLLSGLQRKAGAAQEQLSRARGAAQSLPAIESQLDKLNGNVERLNTTYNDVSKRLGTANLARNAFIAVPTFLRPATLAGQPFGGRAKFLALSLLGGLVLASLAGLLLDRTDRGVHSVDDLHKIIEMPILGSLPALPRGAEGRLTHMSAGQGRKTKQAGLLEASYKLRSRIIAEAYKSGVRSLLFTSPSSGDGKSLCALNAAAALAFDGHRVLLVDVDFWNPAQHLLAEVPLYPGYSEVLGGSAEPEDAMRASSVRNLWILPAGARAANINELAAGIRNRQQLKAMEKAFDFVIIDSPPTLSLADAQVLSSLADGVALVIADSTSREEVQRVEAVLRLTGAHLLGVILNGDKSPGRTSSSRPAHSSASDEGSSNSLDGRTSARLPGTGHQPAPLDVHRD